MSSDTTLTPLSRIVGRDQLVDEMILLAHEHICRDRASVLNPRLRKR